MARKQHSHDHDHDHRTAAPPANGQPAAPEAPLRDQIRLRAYELFEAAPGGSEMEDWLRAEREVRSGQTAALPTGAPPKHD